MSAQPASNSPRRLPVEALFLLGKYGTEPGFLAFMREAQEMGFGLAQPGDHDLTDDEWSEMAPLRMRVLISAFQRRAAR